MNAVLQQQTNIFDQNELKQDLKTYMDRTGTTQASICRTTGINKSALSQWLNGPYLGGDEKKLATRVQAFLKIEKEKLATTRKTIPFVPTSASKDALELIRNCHLNNYIGLLVAPPGLGKTTTIKYYAKENPDTILVQIMPHMSAKNLIKKILVGLGYDDNGTSAELEDTLIRILTNSNRLVIIDEVELLKVDHIELLRRIHDVTDGTFGLVLVGMPILRDMIRGKKHELARLNSRIKDYKALQYLDSEDVALVVREAIPYADDELCKAFEEATYGNTRILANFVIKSLDVATMSNRNQVTPEVVSIVAQMMKKLHGN